MDLAFGTGSVCPRLHFQKKSACFVASCFFCESSLCALCPALRFMWWNRTRVLGQESIIRHASWKCSIELLEFGIPGILDEFGRTMLPTDITT